MRKIIVFNMVSVDGFFAGDDGDISWHNTDEEFNEFAIEQLEEAGGIIFGRVTYDMMASYWPTPGPVKDDPIVANKMNSLPKIVFSRSLEKADWNNTKLLHEIDVEEIKKLKQESDKNLYIFGSGTIAQEFTKLGLIDEYRLLVNPIALGSGKSLFKDKLKLKLFKTREFKNGNVLLCYSA
jgi:dihydrofolate reductase